MKKFIARSLCTIVLTTPLSLRAQTTLGPLAFLQPNDVIVFQGDSITDGGRQRTGTDYNHIMGQDYAYLLAADINATYPERNLNFLNRGIGGDRITDLAARWQTDTLDLKPDTLSILVGINDTLAAGDRAETTQQFEQIYDKLLADTLKALPHTRIVLGQPFMLPVGKYQPDYAARMLEVQQRQAVVARLAAKYHLPLIHYQDVFNAACKRAPANHWSWDGIHPTYAGHWLMAQEWLRVTQSAWPTASSHPSSE